MDDTVHGSAKPGVVVVGGGIAGLTAALRLAERGYVVTVYERSDHLGGDLASRRGSEHELDDVYPHMFLNWYGNFWRLVDDHCGGPRSPLHEPRRPHVPAAGELPDVHQADRPVRSARRVLQNIWSGCGSPVDMFLPGYAAIDLVAERLQPTVLLDDISVTGFFHSRPYMTSAAAAFHDEFLTLVWGLRSSQAAASAYHRFLSFNYRDPTPSLWLLRGPSQELLDRAVAPVVRVTRGGGRARHRGHADRPTGSADRANCTSVRRSLAAAARRSTCRPPTSSWPCRLPASPALVRSRRSRAAPGRRRTRSRSWPSSTSCAPSSCRSSRCGSTGGSRVCPAVPSGWPGAASRSPSPTSRRAGAARRRSRTSRSSASRPPTRGHCPVATTTATGRTGTSCCASSPATCPACSRSATAGASRADIDWTRTRYDANNDARLFLNESGSDEWRPTTTHDAIENVCFAGDFCVTDIDMATVEAAVTSGVQAAGAIVVAARVGATRGRAHAAHVRRVAVPRPALLARARRTRGEGVVDAPSMPCGRPPALPSVWAGALRHAWRRPTPQR